MKEIIERKRKYGFDGSMKLNEDGTPVIIHPIKHFSEKIVIDDFRVNWIAI
jgi:hypothetical protein